MALLARSIHQIGQPLMSLPHGIAEIASRPDRPTWIKKGLRAPTGKGVRLGVIDSGWDRTLSHPQIRAGVGLVDPSDDLVLRQSTDDHDRIGHGTACTDLILRLAPDATIYPIRVFGKQLETSVSTLCAGIQWAVEQQLNLVNISLGTLRGDALRTLYVACEIARRKGVILVAAVHNKKTWSYPAVFENVISVGAGAFRTPFEYTYRQNQGVECLARSVEHDVLSLEGRRESVAGTSFAAPNITGIIALLLERFPGRSLEQIRALLAAYAVVK